MDLPLEILEIIGKEIQDPETLLRFGESSASLRELVRTRIPLVLPSGYVLPWNEFARSGYSQVQGEGTVQVPRDTRLQRASRRIRGNLQLRFSGEDPMSWDILDLLRVRVVLYPTSHFLLLDSDGITMVDWDKKSLLLDLPLEEWEKKDKMRSLFRSLLMKEFRPRVRPEHKDRVLVRFSNLLDKYAPYIRTETLVLDHWTPDVLPPGTTRVHILGGIRVEGVFQDQSWRSVKEIIAPYFYADNWVLENLLPRFPSLQTLIFEDRETLGKWVDEVQSLQSKYPGIKMMTKIILP